MERQIQQLKQKYGTQMMSYPNITCTIKGDRYSISFPIDQRRNTLNNVLSMIDRGFQGIQLKNKENTKVWGVNCIRYDFSENGNDFTISIVGPTNNHFYTFEYSKTQDFRQDFERLRDIYETANKPSAPQRSQNPGDGFRPMQRKVQGDPVENLEQLGAKVFQPEQAVLAWDYLSGYELAKREIEDTILLTLEHPEIYDKITALTRVKTEINRPRAVLFEGPPGTGKTTSAKIIAHQVKIPMVYVRLETIVSKWYGEAEKNLGLIFDNCKQLGKCIIFIDEIDALAQSREGEIHEASRRILSVFLRNLDGFESNENVIVVCATNRKADLDPALLSRFSKVITFPYPDLHSRKAIFAQYAQHLTAAQLQELASLSEGLAGRDIKGICEDAERQWAALVLKGEVSHYSVEYRYYRSALESRKNQYM